MVMTRKCILTMAILILAVFMCACGKSDEGAGETPMGNAAPADNIAKFILVDNTNNEEEEVPVEAAAERELAAQIEKGYNLPIEESEREEATDDCKRIMELIFGIYESADKGIASNVVLSDETVLEIQDRVAEIGCPVHTTLRYSNMRNYEVMDDFLKRCTEGESGSVVMYEVCSDGDIGRRKYVFDGTDMYVLSTTSIWNQNNQPGIAYVSYTRIKEWKYTAKGWFGYELCVPEPPEVTKIVDGSCLIKVKPMTDEQRDFSERCVLGLGYQGNNLLCFDWDAEHLEDLDYNGMYEYLYRIKQQMRFDSEDYPNGIPKDEFESLIMEYLPVTAEQIREYAVFDEENQTYAWARLGCFNYAPDFFGTSLPEVTDIKENEDGTITLTVDAVCDMVVNDDAVITHELTIQMKEDGSFQYLGNKILNDGIRHVPEYQYRFKSR